MASYLLSYDLMKEQTSADYVPLWNELKRLGAQKTQYSVWLINASNTAREIHDHFKKLLDTNDRLWVNEVVRNHYYK